MSVEYDNKVNNYYNGFSHMYKNKKAGNKKAYKSFYASAYEGYGLAFRELGLLFYRGKYVKQNLIIAGLLFIKAHEREPTCVDMLFHMERELSLVFFRARAIYNWIDILSLIYPGQDPQKDFEKDINLRVAFNHSRGIKVNNSLIGDYLYHSIASIIQNPQTIQIQPVFVSLAPIHLPPPYEFPVEGRLREKKNEVDKENKFEEMYLEGIIFEEESAKIDSEKIANKESDIEPDVEGQIYGNNSREGILEFMSNLVPKNLVSQNLVPKNLVSQNLVPDPECSICLLPFEGGKIKLLSCRHQFHPDCISDWLKKSKTCPECRKVID
jgi:hypothetical protein